MNSAIDAAVSRLVARFRRQRPLRAGSLLVTVFGDAIAPRGGAVTLASLIRLLAPLGIAERLVRTSIGRLAAEGWLVRTHSGRVAEYALSASGRVRFAAATRRIYGDASPPWDGRWTLVMLTDLRGADRQRARRELGWAGFGEPTAGVFMHPGCTPADARERLAALGFARTAVILRTARAEPELRAATLLVRAGWRLDELDARYRRFVHAFAPVGAAMAHGALPAPDGAFALRTLLVHEYRRALLRDPLLPPELLPPDWAGAAAYELCRRIYPRVFVRAESHLGAVGARLDGPLPPAAADTADRFGGRARR